MPRRISWIKGALKDFQAFPEAVQEQMTTGLRLAAHGEKADRAKPMQGLLSPTAKNGMKLSDQISPFSFKMDSPHRLQSQFPHR